MTDPGPDDRGTVPAFDPGTEPAADEPIDPAEAAFGDAVDDVLPAERDVARVADAHAAADAPVDTGA